MLQVTTCQTRVIGGNAAGRYGVVGQGCRRKARKWLVGALRPWGQRHETTVFEVLLAQGAVRRPGRGRPRRRPRRVIGDKGYSALWLRQSLRRRGIRITSPRQHTEGRSGPFDRALYRTRNRIERLINRCKQFRRLATRYEKRVVNYRAMWLIAMSLLWL